MKRIPITLLAFTLLIFSACRKVDGEGPLVTQSRPVNNFTGISSECSADVNVHVGPAFNVEITAQQNILNVINTNVENGVLHIDFENKVHVSSHEDITINISMPYADYLRLSGSASMNVLGIVAANHLYVKLSGSGDIVLNDVNITGQIETSISGSGSTRFLQGSAISEDVEITGSGQVDLASVQAQNATTHTSGSGDISLNVSDRLDAHITGSGSVYYHGNPVISTHITGSGRVLPF